MYETGIDATTATDWDDARCSGRPVVVAEVVTVKAEPSVRMTAGADSTSASALLNACACIAVELSDITGLVWSIALALGAMSLSLSAFDSAYRTGSCSTVLSALGESV